MLQRDQKGEDSMEEERRTQAKAEESGPAAAGELQRDRAGLLRELVNEMQRSTDVSTFFLQFVAARTGIHVTDIKVLSLLSRLGPLNASRIADLSGLTTGAITFVLDRLEKLGYARRVRSAKDRRVVLTEINPEALAGGFGNYFMRMAEITVEAATQLTDEQLVLIVNFTQKLNKRAEEVLQEMKNDSM
ncbi:transcriptional regulator [Ktedonobacter sp. SOSP1-52]|uniref:MarR family winged helix-turn-helix transcriptional regulator n=1 Tax=Ktedonobacter sp. SOSP1-52 TaxID=2778366 RepID=UPI001916A26D|nr:MarR family transcriptional regulator [Ktedonobacter sp. SOSP1-52]GHO68080.1 transcriptional regulator [Ktedonobacter sp. SOSP1-52]